MGWTKPLLLLIVLTVVGLGGFELLLPVGRASEPFYSASATVAAALFVAMTLAAAPIFGAAPEGQPRARYVAVWGSVVAVGFVFNAAATSGSLAALTHCKVQADGQNLCGNAFNTHLVGAALIVGIAVLFAQIAATARRANKNTDQAE